MLRLIFSVLTLIVCTAAAGAWNDTGHMIVAQIAHERLSSRVRERVDELALIGAEPASADFVSAACWPDDLKSWGIKTYNDWHFVNLPFSTDGTPLPRERATINIIWAMNQCAFALKKRPSDPRFPNAALRAVPDSEKARMLRFLIHLVGDAHQPLHSVSRFSKRHTHGDRGGNEFSLGETNLHAFWDNGGGLFDAIWLRPLSAERRIALEKAAREISMAHPAMAQARNGDFAHWAQEGLQLAKNVVYKTPENQKPSAAYIANARKISAQRVALAGYRLADLLNRIFENE